MTGPWLDALTYPAKATSGGHRLAEGFSHGQRLHSGASCPAGKPHPHSRLPWQRLHSGASGPAARPAFRTRLACPQSGERALGRGVQCGWRYRGKRLEAHVAAAEGPPSELSGRAQPAPARGKKRKRDSPNVFGKPPFPLRRLQRAGPVVHGEVLAPQKADLRPDPDTGAAGANSSSHSTAAPESTQGPVKGSQRKSHYRAFRRPLQRNREGRCGLRRQAQEALA